MTPEVDELLHDYRGAYMAAKEALVTVRNYYKGRFDLMNTSGQHAYQEMLRAVERVLGEDDADAQSDTSSEVSS